MTYTLGRKSEERLTGVHPDLVKVVRRAIALSPIDFSVIEGLRTLERQRQLIRMGASKTLHSRHLTGHAVDLMALVDNKPSWNAEHYVGSIEMAMKGAANELGVPIEWGGDWFTLKDYVHWQLPKAIYP